MEGGELDAQLKIWSSVEVEDCFLQEDKFHRKLNFVFKHSVFHSLYSSAIQSTQTHTCFWWAGGHTADEQCKKKLALLASFK